MLIPPMKPLLLACLGLLTVCADSLGTAPGSLALPYPDVAPAAALPSSPIALRFTVTTVSDQGMGTGDYEVYRLESPQLTLATPPLERWYQQTGNRSHSLVLFNPLLEGLTLTLDVYPTDMIPAISTDFLCARVNAQTLALQTAGFNQCDVSLEEDGFRATPPTRTIKMADGREIAVPKRGRTRPFRVAEEFVYTIDAAKTDDRGQSLATKRVQESICVHPGGHVYVITIQGEADQVSVARSWLTSFLRNCQEIS